MYFDEIIASKWKIEDAFKSYMAVHHDPVDAARELKSDLIRTHNNPNLLKSAQNKAGALLKSWNVRI
jgi:hypothetical protein